MKPYCPPATNPLGALKIFDKLLISTSSIYINRKKPKWICVIPEM